MGSTKKESKKIVKAELVRCKEDEFGDIVEAKIREVKTGKTRVVSAEQLQAVMQAGLIKVSGLAISSTGKVFKRKKHNLTRRKSTKYKINEIKKEIEKLENSIEKDIETSHRIVDLKRKIALLESKL
jgi:hypothetical protein